MRSGVKSRHVVWPLGTNGEASGTSTALEPLEEFLPDSRVVDFFLGVIDGHDPVRNSPATSVLAV